MSQHKPEYLRPEARPLRWHELDYFQQTAFTTLLNILNEALGDIAHKQTSPKRQQAPWLDYTRKVRAAILSGQRGTGKTTVLLSLLRAFETSPSSATDLPGDLREKLNPLVGRLTWLEPLDMSPLPPSTNLFAAILARLENRLGKRAVLEEEVNAIGTSGDIDVGHTYHNAFSRFTRLQTDVALAWEGNLAQRAGSLDPSQYAMEVMRAEHVRLSLNERLSNVLDGLAEFSQGSSANDPLFVLPIDDFDLNPAHCLDLLDLLRLISVRRLFFVVLGDIDTAQLVCTAKLAGDMVKVAVSHTNNPFLPPTLQGEIAARTRQIAGNRLRKLLPPSQRIEVRGPDLVWAMKYRPPGKDSDQTMKDLLDQCPVPLSSNVWKSKRISKRHISSLTDFLFAPPLNVSRPNEGTQVAATEGTSKPHTLGQSQVDQRLANAFYHARYFLEVPFRILADYWFSFHNLLTTTTLHEPLEERIANSLFTHFQEAVTSDPAVGAAQLRSLTSQLFVDPAGNWQLPLGTVNISAAVATQGKVAILSGQQGFKGVRNLQISTLENYKRPWDFWPPPTHIVVTQTQGPIMPTVGVPLNVASSAHVSPYVERIMTLCTDILTLSHPYAKKSALLPGDLNGYRFAVSEWIEGNRIAEWPWPFPPLGTYWEYELFLNAWGRASNLVVSLQREYSAILLVFVWIDLSIAVVSGDEPLGIPAGGTLAAQDWTDLFGRLGFLLSDSTGGGPASVDLREWIAQLPTILGPEWLGEQRSVWEALNTTSPLIGFWRSTSPRFVDQLRQRLQQFKELIEWATGIRVPWAEAPDTPTSNGHAH